MRVKFLLPLGLLGAAAPPAAAVESSVPVTAMSLPNVNESGRVLAQLDDVRAIFFVLILVIVVLIFDRWLDRRSARATIRDFKEAADGLAAAIDRQGTHTAERATAVLVHNARVESVLGRIEHHLDRFDGSHER